MAARIVPMNSLLRVVWIAVALAVSPAVAASPRAAADREPVVLAGHAVTVSDPVIRLGDLFLNAGDKASTPVARAPMAGRQAVFDARWLFHVARTNGLDWQPLSVHDRISVERESVIVRGDEIGNLVLAALDAKGVDTADTRVALANPALRIHLPADGPSLPVVADIDHDPRHGTFVALLSMGGGASAQQVRVAGRLQQMTEVPVLNRRLDPGEVITAADLATVAMPTRSLPGGTILAAADLVGNTARPGVRPGTPLRASDVRAPLVVTRGQAVTLLYGTPQMILTARGRAIDSGSTGDVVRVTNVQSRAVVEGTVTGAGEVTIQDVPGGQTH
jgi:flagella basal body P-ring formation protein FlgA